MGLILSVVLRMMAFPRLFYHPGKFIILWYVMLLSSIFGQVDLSFWIRVFVMYLGASLGYGSCITNNWVSGVFLRVLRQGWLMKLGFARRGWGCVGMVGLVVYLPYAIKCRVL